MASSLAPVQAPFTGAPSDPLAPFSEHWAAWQAAFAAHPAEAPPLAAWQPTEDARANSNLARFMQLTGHGSYEDLHAWSATRRADFWSAALHDMGITYHTPPTRVLQAADDPDAVAWLPGAELNAAAQCFHAPGDRVAIRQRDEAGNEVDVTYGDLEARVRRIATGLRGHGLAPGDGVALYMPMTIDCVAVYLAAVWAGLHVVSIPDSFSADEVATRLRLGDARLLVTVASFRRGGKDVPMAPKALDAATAAGGIDVVAVDGADGCLDLADLETADGMDAVAVAPDTVSNVLFSSGTTGEPKAIGWTHLTPLKAAMDGRYHQDIRPDDVVAWPTNIGWMMGPWLIYATFVNHATMMLYVGAPVGDGFLDWVRDSKTTVLGLVPALARSWLATHETTDRLAGVRLFSSTGEASNAHDYLWLMSRAGYRAPIIEYCGGTEIGGGHVTGAVLQPQSPATFSTPALGLDFVVLNSKNDPIPAGGHGQIWLRPPSIGLSQRLLNRDHGAEYYADCPPDPDGSGRPLRRHGDEMHVLAGGYYAAGGRADDTMNLGGIKVSSVELETTMNGAEGVVETAAIAVRPDGGGADQLIVYAVTPPTAATADPTALQAALQAAIKSGLNPLFRIHEVVVIDKLPRTASNKVMRRVLRNLYLADRRVPPSVQ